MATEPPLFNHLDTAERPNIILMSIGHSGSTPVAKAIALCGWNFCDTCHHYDRRSEKSHIATINGALFRHRAGRKRTDWIYNDGLDAWIGPDPETPEELDALMREEWKRITCAREGTVVKDPRWCQTLDFFQDTILELDEPLLLWLQRDLKDVEWSCFRRSEFVMRGGNKIGGYQDQSVYEIHELCHQRYEEWPGRKRIIRFDEVCRAAADRDLDWFVRALGIEEFGRFGEESCDLGMQIIDPDMLERGTRRRAASGWDPQFRFGPGRKGRGR